jgi:tetratricopeptide (TPR) repeat protein
LLIKRGEIIMQQIQDLMTRAHALRLQGQDLEAIELYKESIRLQPTAEAYNSLGISLSSLKRYEEAAQENLNAIYLDDSYWLAYNDLAFNLFKLERIAEAVIWYEKAINRVPDELSHIVYSNLGEAFELKKSWMEAMNCYVEALTNNPKYEPALQGVIRMS